MNDIGRGRSRKRTWIMAILIVSLLGLAVVFALSPAPIELGIALVMAAGWSWWIDRQSAAAGPEPSPDGGVHLEPISSEDKSADGRTRRAA